MQVVFGKTRTGQHADEVTGHMEAITRVIASPTITMHDMAIPTGERVVLVTKVTA
jgi:hypothetical protein